MTDKIKHQPYINMELILTSRANSYSALVLLLDLISEYCSDVNIVTQLPHVTTLLYYVLNTSTSLDAFIRCTGKKKKKHVFLYNKSSMYFRKIPSSTTKQKMLPTQSHAHLPSVPGNPKLTIVKYHLVLIGRPAKCC